MVISAGAAPAERSRMKIRLRRAEVQHADQIPASPNVTRDVAAG